MPRKSGGRRDPVWSQALTTPLARAIPARLRPTALVAIKTVHTLIFFSISGLIALFAWDGLRQNPRRRTAVAVLISLAETAVFASNNQVCPLTPLAEELGAERGSVTDIFLPDPISRRIPLFGGGVLVIGLILNGRVIVRRHSTI